MSSSPLIIMNQSVGNLTLDSIIEPRLPPITWDILGYIGGIANIVCYNKTVLFAYAGLFVLYGLLNIIFDTYTISCEYTSNQFPDYNGMNLFERLYVCNKKYKIQERQICDGGIRNIHMVDCCKLQLDIYFYINDNCLKHLMKLIYKLGITKKNFTIINYTQLYNREPFAD